MQYTESMAAEIDGSKRRKTYILVDVMEVPELKRLLTAIDGTTLFSPTKRFRISRTNCPEEASGAMKETHTPTKKIRARTMLTFARSAASRLTVVRRGLRSMSTASFDLSDAFQVRKRERERESCIICVGLSCQPFFGIGWRFGLEQKIGE